MPPVPGPVKYSNGHNAPDRTSSRITDTWLPRTGITLGRKRWAGREYDGELRSAIGSATTSECSCATATWNAASTLALATVALSAMPRSIGVDDEAAVSRRTSKGTTAAGRSRSSDRLPSTTAHTAASKASAVSSSVKR